jgi:membrane protease YdiL (CAAX protease family)
VEEVAFRGTLLPALTRANAATVPAVALQGALFGCMHACGGFPNGVPGLAPAAIYGTVLGVRLPLTSGRLLPVATPVRADRGIFALVRASAHPLPAAARRATT